MMRAMWLRVTLVLMSSIAVGSGAVHVAATVAGDDPTWATVAVDATGTCASVPRVAVDRRGRALEAWSECVNGRDAVDGYVTVVATHRPGGRLRRAARLPGTLTSLTPGLDGAALLTLTDERRRGLLAADVTTGGGIGATARLSRRFLRFERAASNDRGMTVVAWVTNRLPQRLQVRVRARGERAFGALETVAVFAREGDVGRVSVAVGPRGELAVLWASARGARRSMLARIRRAGAPTFGPPVRVGRSDRLATIASAFTATGRLVAVWSSADAGEQQDRPAVVRVASLRRGGRRFTRERVLGVGVGRERTPVGPAVAAIAAGDGAVVAWTSAGARVRVASVTPRGTVARPRTLDTDGLLADLVASRSGTVLVTWLHHAEPNAVDARIHAAVRPVGDPFGEGEPAGPPRSRPGGAALDRSGTRALVAWTTAGAASSPQIGISMRVLR